MNEKIEKAIKECELHKVKVLQLKSSIKIVEEIIQENPECKLAYLITWQVKEPTVDVSWFCRSKDEISTVLRLFGAKGIHQKERATNSAGLNGMIGVKVYVLTHNITINSLLFNLPGESQGKNCRMEQIGTKEVPVYEMKCD